MSQHIHEQIKAVCAKAEARAYRTAKRKLVAEQKRHDTRLAEIDSELQGELEVARAALALIPKEGDGAPEPTPEDDEPNMVEVPKGAATPYTPRAERLTGRAREK